MGRRFSNDRLPVRAILRITLSYFIEPGPGERGWNNRYCYSSHGLRFDVNKPGETSEAFQTRLNVAAREEGEAYNFDHASDRWTLGKKTRDVGSIHSDFIKGTAAELATCNWVGIYPVAGWWKERDYLNKFDRQARYSLVVSITTPREDVDLYTPVSLQVAAEIEPPVLVEVEA